MRTQNRRNEHFTKLKKGVAWQKKILQKAAKDISKKRRIENPEENRAIFLTVHDEVSRVRQ